jgi:5-formyltetrahydrofolate cyclo-ligase
MRDKHGLDPDVVLTDKDFAEIGAARAVWPRAKHQLCYWHMRKSVRERMALSRLSTAPYHLFEANAEFGFISMQFLPRCGPDRKDPDSEKRSTSCLSTPHMPGPKFPPTRLPTIVIPVSSCKVDM